MCDHTELVHHKQVRSISYKHDTTHQGDSCTNLQLLGRHKSNISNIKRHVLKIFTHMMSLTGQSPRHIFYIACLVREMMFLAMKVCF